MDLVKQLFEPILKGLVFGALVEFAHEVAAGAEGVVAEGQGSIAEILPSRGKEAIASASVLSRVLRMEGREKEEGQRVEREKS